MHEQITRLVCIADDLTGALDSTAPFCAVGQSVAVATRPEAFASALASEASVVAVSTRSRDLPPDVAGALMRRVLAQVPTGVRIMKKVDSRLKGPVAAELAALPGGPLLVLPAIPEMGRVVQDGAMSGFGIGAPIAVRPLLGARGADAEIPDTSSDAEIQAALAQATPDTILVGARGLGQALAQTMGARPRHPVTLHGRIAIAVGSTDPITLAQVAALTGVTRIEAPSGAHAGVVPDGGHVLMMATAGEETDGARIAARLARSFAPLARGCDTLILTGGATAEAVLDELAVDCLIPMGEALPGLPVSQGGRWRIVTKSGGFGAPDTLSHLCAVSEDVA